MKNAFCNSLKPDKRKDIKRKEPIPDTSFTKVPELDPTIQSRMSATAKLTDWGLAGMQGYVLYAAVPLVKHPGVGQKRDPYPKRHSRVCTASPKAY